MNTLKILNIIAFLIMQICISSPGAAEGEKQNVSLEKAEKLASEAIIRLNKEIVEITSSSTTRLVATSNKSESEKSTQDRLTEEHQRAKDGGYDKEYHRAIKENGGTRLKEEWKENCKSRVMKGKPGSADLAETNCY